MSLCLVGHRPLNAPMGPEGRAGVRLWLIAPGVPVETGRTDPLADVPRITPSPFAGALAPNIPAVLKKPGFDEKLCGVGSKSMPFGFSAMSSLCSWRWRYFVGCPTAS
jgi:hypothetical protein